MKRSFLGILAGALATFMAASLGVLPVSADDNATYGNIPSNATEILKISDGYRRVSLDERSSEVFNSAIYIETPTADGIGNWATCSDPTEGKCSGYRSKRMGGTSVLPICEDKLENCIQSVAIFREGSEKEPATFVKNIAGEGTAGDKSMGVPRGSTIPVFESSTTPHTDGNQFAVVASISWGKWPGQKLGFDSFDLRVAATKEEAMPEAEIGKATVCVAPEGTSNAGHLGVCGGWSRAECVYSETGICGRDKKFAEGTRIGVKLKLSNKMTGWLRGRIKDPLFEVKKIDANYNEVYIEASPVKVPKLYTQYKVTNTLKSKIKDQGTTWGYSAETLTYSYFADSQAGVDVIELLRKSAEDTGSAERDMWTVSSFDSSFKRCLSSSTQLQGLVTTNAMAYMGTEPEWKGGMLNYKVAGMHYLADGMTEAIGTYDLVMRSSAARCLYGFSKAPIYGVVSVRSASGEKKVATTVVSEKNGWLKLAAYNFTFSSPTISVKLTQKKR